MQRTIPARSVRLVAGSFHGGLIATERNLIRLSSALLLVPLTAAAISGRVAAQSPGDASLRNTRAQLEAEIAAAERILESPGYSGRIKQIKRQEIGLLRSRLEDGDLQPGDQINLSVQGEDKLTGVFAVSAARTVTLPGIADISLRGVLRSELQDYLTNELRKYIRNPVVHVQTTVRLSILGSVGKPGFYQVESEKMIGDAIMAAGGPGAGVDPAKTRVERSGVIIMDRDAFTEALNAGRTLDQMSLRAGDEIVVGGGRTATAGRSGLGGALPVLTGITALGVLVVQIIR
jgi:hypothetical protein